MKTALASFISLVALALTAGCATENDSSSDPDVNSSDVVGVTDLTEMEASLGLEKDVKLPNGKWSRGDDKLQGGACWKARFASAAHDPSHWEFRRYKNGAAFFRKLGVTALEGDERAVYCVDLDGAREGLSDPLSLEGMSLDFAFRSKLGTFQSGDGAAGHLYFDFSRIAIEARDADHLCGFYTLEGWEKSIDPALKAGTQTLASCGGPNNQECARKAYDACRAAFATDAKGDGSIDRPAFYGYRLVGIQDDSIDPSVAAFVYRYSLKNNTDAKRFSMAADPVGSFKSHRAKGVEDVTVYDRMEVHHVTLNGHVEGLYLTAVNESGDPASKAKASCERSVDADGTPTTAYACKGL